MIVDFEASLIRLLDKITNGSHIEVDETGTQLIYRPGLLYGGRIEHSCSVKRGIGYYLEVLMALAPMCKQKCNITLRGVTNNKVRGVFSVPNIAMEHLEHDL